jgi:hypothetical protein
MGMACLSYSPGISCLYDGTEQGQNGAGSDPAAREALWGIAPTFPRIGFPVSRAVPPLIRRQIAA